MRLVHRDKSDGQLGDGFKPFRIHQAFRGDEEEPGMSVAAIAEMILF